MKSVSISDLKANLSRYIRAVRRGAEVQVVDRGVPVARLVPLAQARGSDADRLARLVRSGVIRAGTAEPVGVIDEPPIRIDASLSEALAEDRRARD
jgi:prevent-host-death family protein